MLPEVTLTDIAEALATSAKVDVLIEHTTNALYSVTITLMVLPRVVVDIRAPFLGAYGMQELSFCIHVTWDLLVHPTFLPDIIKEYKTQCETTA
jgi:hypothetical protein